MKLTNYNPLGKLTTAWQSSVGLVGNWNQWSNQEETLIAAAKNEPLKTMVNFLWPDQPVPLVTTNGLESLGTKYDFENGINYYLPPIMVNSLASYNPFEGLKKVFHLQKIYVLENYPFVSDLQNFFGEEKVILVPAPPVNQSPNKLKKALENGNLKTYHQLVGANYNFNGLVVEAKQLGRSIGFPTANLRFSRPLPIREGVYLVKTYLQNQNQFWWGMGDYWSPPQFGWTFETHIFNFDQNIYGQTLNVELISYYRPNRPLLTKEAIKKQLIQDQNALQKLIPKK